MATWDWAESPGSQLFDEPRVRKTQFGDGYVQRSPDGINNMPAKWQLTFKDVTLAAGDAMVAFLRARGGVEAFDWCPPRETALKRWTCSSWSRTLPDADGLSTVQAVFEQDFGV